MFVLRRGWAGSEARLCEADSLVRDECISTMDLDRGLRVTTACIIDDRLLAPVVMGMERRESMRAYC